MYHKQTRFWILPICLTVMIMTVFKTSFESSALETSSYRSENSEKLNQWVHDFKHRARQKGYSKTLLNQVFRTIHYNPAILKSQTHQAEYITPILDYVEKRANQAQINLAKQNLRGHQAILQNIENDFKLDKEIIIAIWGIETGYGKFLGNHNLFEALAMLAAYTYRTSFAEKQIYALLDMLDRQLVKQDWLKGSWAGAMGHVQFIPTSYLNYGVDYDKDQKIDIWFNKQDAFASTANYLKKHGWKYQTPCYLPVRLPEKYQLSLTSQKKPGYAWAKEGITPKQNKPWIADHLMQSGTLYLPEGIKGPALLLFKNFNVIKRYNSSNSYALAVCEIYHRLKGETSIEINPQRERSIFSKQQIKTLQQRLNLLEFHTGKPDGIIGKKTRKAIKAFQVKYNLNPDGYLSQSLYRKILDS